MITAGLINPHDLDAIAWIMISQRRGDVFG